MAAESDDGGGEGVLSRWSRLKREEARRETEPEALPKPSDDAAGEGAEARADGAKAPEAGAAAQADEEPMLTEADLPDIESLTFESDFSVFMKRNVPLALQKRALRKLWVSSPVLANLDGLNDHDLDYTIAEMKDIATQSAADLASGVKRLNVTDLRMRDREARRATARGALPREAAAEPPEALTPPAEDEAETDPAVEIERVDRKLDS